jgi:ABC-type nitrate/sulfonate/bicarbonate transport systems, periplasmic components
MKKISFLKLCAPALMLSLLVTAFTGCGTDTDTEATPTPGSAVTATPAPETATPAPTEVVSSGKYYDAGASAESIVSDAAGKGQVGNWGLGNEYEIQALLSKYNQPTTYLSQNFDMDGFDDDSILLASAMTYNELGLVINSYDGGYGYGDTVKYIDMNDEGVAMLEDNIFCDRAFAEANPNTVKAFIYASMKGWEYACAHPEEAAEIVYNYGSSVSGEHQLYMADQVKGLSRPTPPATPSAITVIWTRALCSRPSSWPSST